MEWVIGTQRHKPKRTYPSTAVSFTVRNPKSFVCSLWQHPVLKGAVDKLSSRTSHQLLDCDVKLRFTTKQLCLDRVRHTSTGCIFSKYETLCGNPDPSGASQGGPSKQTAIVFSGEAFTGNPHASRSRTCPTDCTHPLPNTEVGNENEIIIHPPILFWSSNGSRCSTGTTLTHELHHHHTFMNHPFQPN